MKKFLLLLCVIVILGVAVGCNASEDTGADNSSDAQTEVETEPPAETVNPDSRNADGTYTTNAGSVLNTYRKSEEKDYRGVCRYYTENSYTLYRESDMNGNLSSTFTKDDTVIHVYYQPVLRELNIVTDADGISMLPPAQPEVTTGDASTSVTQIKSGNLNGMGYVFRLADGSFLIYDGGYTNNSDELWNTLTTLNGSEDGIHIRMWLLTHSHDDHYPCFVTFGKDYGSKVTLDYIMYAPLNKADILKSSGGSFFTTTLTSKFKLFPDAKICLPHTGMTFSFCDVTVEILSTAEEIYIDGNPENFNNSSIVSRVKNKDSSVLMLADCAHTCAAKMIACYGSYLKSDMCQIAHHGVEDFPLSGYQLINAKILFYPCNQALYDYKDRDRFVRDYLKNSPDTKEILIQENDRYTRNFHD